jgi:chromosomal replication initiator protein
MENLKKSSDDQEKEKASSKNIPTGLNPKYTFDNFVVGNSNRFAHAL